jgi:hypothetical protein
MALGSADPITDTSTKNLSVGKALPEHKADNLTAKFEPIV